MKEYKKESGGKPRLNLMRYWDAGYLPGLLKTDISPSLTQDKVSHQVPQ